jgi:hypothetical protein
MIPAHDNWASRGLALAFVLALGTANETARRYSPRQGRESALRSAEASQPGASKLFYASGSRSYGACALAWGEGLLLASDATACRHRVDRTDTASQALTIH